MKITRRKFYVLIATLLLGIPIFRYIYSLISDARKTTKLNGKLTSPSYKIGHKLWSKIFVKPKETVELDVLIIGGGVAGLSAARELKKRGINNFAILELESEVGGNARSSENFCSKFPLGAHYLPIPSIQMVELLDFLTEIKVIERFNDKGLPFYNEEYLCAAPDERLYINGRWQEGLVPEFGISENDKSQIFKFLELMENFKKSIGSDEKWAFDIPVEKSSNDLIFRKLDKVTFKEYLISNKFDSEYLHWYVDYCCKDDYGTSYEEISAWAGIHYFASRRGEAVNANKNDVLTWCEGNDFLVKHLKSAVSDKILYNQLAYSINENSNGRIEVYTYDSKNEVTKTILCNNVIVACPQFVIKHFKSNIKEIKNRNYNLLKYCSWMVANLLVKKSIKERGGVPLAWDNVIYGTSSLGYVVSNHQNIHQSSQFFNFTFYQSLSSKRLNILNVSREKWLEQIFKELEKVYLKINDECIEADVHIWGHAMVKPLPGFFSEEKYEEFKETINDKIFFVHTDVSGISIFEQAFYNGLNAATKIANQK